MIAELNALMAGVNQMSNASDLLCKVQEIVFGTSDVSKRNWNVRRRIDDFDFSRNGFSLCVSDGTLRAAFRFQVSFKKQQRLRRVA